MENFLKQIEIFLIDMWNYLYRFLCHLSDVEPDEDNRVDPPVSE